MKFLMILILMLPIGCTASLTSQEQYDKVKAAAGDTGMRQTKSYLTYSTTESAFTELGEPEAVSKPGPHGTQSAVWTWKTSDGAVETTVDIGDTVTVSREKFVLMMLSKGAK